MNTKLLAIWLIENKLQKKDLATLLSTSQSQISHYISNDFYIGENGEQFILFKRSKSFTRSELLRLD